MEGCPRDHRSQGRLKRPVPRQKSHTGPELVCPGAGQAALPYSLIRLCTTWVRLIWPVISIGWPGSCSGGRCSGRGPMFAVMPRILGQDVPKVLFNVDQAAALCRGRSRPGQPSPASASRTAGPSASRAGGRARVPRIDVQVRRCAPVLAPHRGWGALLTSQGGPVLPDGVCLVSGPEGSMRGTGVITPSTLVLARTWWILGPARDGFASRLGVVRLLVELSLGMASGVLPEVNGSRLRLRVVAKRVTQRATGPPAAPCALGTRKCTGRRGQGLVATADLVLVLDEGCRGGWASGCAGSHRPGTASAVAMRFAYLTT